MDKPLFPLIGVYEKDYLIVISSESEFSKTSTRALINVDHYNDIFLYDREGNKWICRQEAESFKNTFLTRLLARTVYNPVWDATIIWNKIGCYELAELKKRISKCVDKDDDVLTQFVEGQVIKNAISQSADFDEIIYALNKYVFEAG